jgi:transposase-like protein
VRKEDGMSRKRYKPEQIINLLQPEQIINLLREAEVALSGGQTVGQICRSLGISEQSYYRWRSEYGGMKLEQVKRLKDLEKENVRLKRAVAELTLDKLILKEAAEGNY